MRFDLIKTDEKTQARAGVMTLPHGVVNTPVFMPVGTQGTVKGCLPSELERMEVQILLGNTYHLLLRPGTERLEALGGLHRFMNWPRPILTDSGGFQVFSLAKLVKIDAEGVNFQSHLDGHQMRLTPESVMLAQSQIGSDIGMVLDVCPPGNADESKVEEAVATTVDWAKMACSAAKRPANIFGIVQGGRFPHLRKACAEELLKLDFDGYAIGGVAVGECEEDILAQIRQTAPLLPTGKPRYAMGIGEPTQLLEMISHGVDMFDCVIPTREARHGIAYTNMGRLNMKNEKFKDDLSPLDPIVTSPASLFSRAYIRHLIVSEELLGLILLTYHNIAFFMELMKNARASILNGTFSQWKETWIRNYHSTS